MTTHNIDESKLEEFFDELHKKQNGRLTIEDPALELEIYRSRSLRSLINFILERITEGDTAITAEPPLTPKQVAAVRRPLLIEIFKLGYVAGASVEGKVERKLLQTQLANAALALIHSDERDSNDYSEEAYLFAQTIGYTGAGVTPENRQIGNLERYQAIDDLKAWLEAFVA